MPSKPLMLENGYSGGSDGTYSGGAATSPLEQAVQTFIKQNAQQNAIDNPPVETARVGPAGVNLLVNRPKSSASRVNDYLANMGQQYLETRSTQKRGQFIQGVHQIMGSNAPREDKMGALMDLQVKYGTDFGLGINDMAKKLGLTVQPSTAKTAKEQGPNKSDMVLGGFQLGYATDKKGQRIDLSDPDAMHQYALSTLGGNYDTKYPQVADAIMNKVKALVPSLPLTEEEIAKVTASNPASPAGSAPSAPASAPATATGASPAGTPVAAPVSANGQPAPQVQTAIPGMIYVNPQTGEKRKYLGNGQWQPG